MHVFDCLHVVMVFESNEFTVLLEMVFCCQNW